MRVVGRHEDDCGRRGEASQHPGEVEAVEPGHPDVDEERVDRRRFEQAQRLRAVGRGEDGRDALVPAEEVGELGARGCLVVDGEDAQPAAILVAGALVAGGLVRRVVALLLGHACTPGANFGTRIDTFVPSPGAVSTTRPYSSPNT